MYSGIAGVSKGGYAYAYCVQEVTSTDVGAGQGSAHLASTGRCYLFPQTPRDSCNPNTMNISITVELRRGCKILC